jgi:uncharacterized protein YceH (UPF0502 family)
VNLTAEQARVLGCLAEKEATTPDGYPLSTNALVLACNQRSSRDPVVDYDESTVTATMTSLRELGLARTARGEGSRVYKHSHVLREALGLDGAGLAVLSVLMLRGPQTAGELRTRTERQHPFASLESVEGTLAELAAREEPLVEPLPRAPGQKEARWTQLLAGGTATPGRPAEAPEPTPSGPPREDELAGLRREVDELRRRVEALETADRSRPT